MHIYLRGDGLQKLRLASGLVLFLFAATHFINHALGLVSLEVMHQVQDWRKLVTRSWPGTILLALAALTHVGLALWKIARRSTWRMPPWEAAQILVALAIPFLLIPHVMFTRVAASKFGVDDTYSYELVWLWPAYAVTQSVLLVLVWAHGCIGLHYWLRLSGGYRRIAPWMLIPALAVPTLALAGYMAAGEATVEIMSDEAVLEAMKERSRWPQDEAVAYMFNVGQRLRYAFAGLLVLVAGAYLWRQSQLRQRAEAEVPKPSSDPILALTEATGISYHDGPTVDLIPGMTLLEVSRANRIPHASVCGGRARCGTCQVRVLAGLAELPVPALAEIAVLKSIEAEPDIRLACQCRPTAPVTISVLFRPEKLQPIPVEFVEVKEVASAHLRAVLANETIDVLASDQPTFKDWMAGRVAYKVALEELSAEGFVLKGARLEFLHNRPAVALTYERRNRPVTLFMLPSGDATSVAVSGQKNGQHVLGWSDSRYAYFAVSELDRSQLEQLEESFASRARLQSRVAI